MSFDNRNDLRKQITEILENKQLPEGSIETRDIRGRLMSSIELGATVTALENLLINQARYCVHCGTDTSECENCKRLLQT